MKEKIHQACLKLINERIQLNLVALQEARESFINETKSSVGDKHETSREMAGEELRKLEMNHSQLLHIALEFERINPFRKQELVQLGSLVKTNKGLFYIASAIGQVQVDNESVYVISLKAPLAKAMLGKSVGMPVVLNGQTQDILQIT